MKKNKLKLEISAIEPEFMPVDSQVKVLVPSLNHLNVQSIRLNNRNFITVDTGIEIVIPEGYVLNVITNREFASRGLLIVNNFVDNKKLKLVIANLGQENPIEIHHKTAIGTMQLVPIARLEI